MPPSADDARIAGLARDVQSQAARLRQRLATAPPLQPSSRNPFAFDVRELPTPRPTLSAVPEAAGDVATDEPALRLIGIAEDRQPTGLVRTAVIAGDGDQLHMVIEGQTIAGRYRVLVVSADAVELEDLTTGVTRRLVLT
jgi:hypothetical protein